MDSFQLVPVELIDQILSYVDFRDHLSLRLVNKRFSLLACAAIFSSVVTLYGEDGLQKLHQIASHTHLAWHVKRFEYRFVGIYEHAMSWERFRARMTPPGKSYHGLLLPQFHCHYEAQYRIHQSILRQNTDASILLYALQRFPNLHHVSVRHAGIDEYPHWQESWSFTLRNEILGGTRARENVARALEARHARASCAIPDIAFSDITSYSAIHLPPAIFREDDPRSGNLKYRYELNPIATGPSSGLSSLHTLNLDLRLPRQPRAVTRVKSSPGMAGHWSSAILSVALRDLRSLVNVRLCVDENHRYVPRFFEHPLNSVFWPKLRQLILSGWGFTRREELTQFIARHVESLQYLYIGTLCLVVEKEEVFESSFCRLFDEVRELTSECTFEGSLFGILRQESEKVEIDGSRVAVSVNRATEGARRKRRVVEKRVFGVE